MEKLYAQLLHQLEELTKLVRGDLPPLARLTLGSLIVIDVHARDVVKHLVESGMFRCLSFFFLVFIINII